MLFFFTQKIYFTYHLSVENKVIAVVGAKGKMGSEVCKSLSDVFDVVEIDKNDSLFEYGNIDLVIDFASAESSVQSAEYCFKNQIPLIVGSTGQSEEELIEIQKVASVAPLVISANFSIGIAIFKHLIQKMSAFCSFFEDVIVFEKHHKQKKDAPSGTAKELQKQIYESFDLNAEIIAERGGKEIGTHVMDMYFGDEVLSVKHQAFSRKAFSDGVKLVTLNIWKKQKGVYEFADFVKNE